MLIISKERDYYDYCAGLGLDKGICYKREPAAFNAVRQDRRGKFHLNDGGEVEQQIFNKIVQIKQQLRLPPDKAGVGLVFVGVAGRIYVGIHHVEKVPSPEIPLLQIDKHSFYWNAADASELMRLKPRKRLYYSFNSYADSFEEWFKKDQKVFKAPEIFSPSSAPVFCFYNATLITNPILQDVRFQKVMDATQVFQELSMFLVNQNEATTPPATSDQDLVVAKGFDDTSFKGPARIKKRKLRKQASRLSRP